MYFRNAEKNEKCCTHERYVETIRHSTSHIPSVMKQGYRNAADRYPSQSHYFDRGLQESLNFPFSLMLEWIAPRVSGVKTNYFIADFLNRYKQGIFRKSTITNDFKHDIFDKNVVSAQYVSFNDTENNNLKFARIVEEFQIAFGTR